MLERKNLRAQFDSESFAKSSERYRESNGLDTNNPTLWDVLFADTDEIKPIEAQYNNQERRRKRELAKTQFKLANEMNVDLINDSVSLRREQIDHKIAHLCE